MELRDWTPVLALVVPLAVAVLAWVGIVINANLTSHASYRKTQWEKKREVYTELLRKMRVIMGIVHAQEDMRRHAVPEQFSEAMSKPDFKESVAELRTFVEDNILYISEEMEKALQPLWSAFDSIYKRTGGRAIGERTPSDQKQELFFKVTTSVNDEVNAHAQKEIHVP